MYKLKKSVVDPLGNKQWVELGSWETNPTADQVKEVFPYKEDVVYETLDAGCVVIHHPLNSVNAETYKLVIE